MESIKKKLANKGKEIGLIEAISAMLPIETEIKLKDPDMTLQIKVTRVKMDKQDAYFALLVREVKEKNVSGKTEK